jgi:cytochrome c oxidase subunit IV
MSKHQASHQHHQSAAQKQQKSDKNTQLYSRILLTVFILAGMSPALYFMYRGLVIWGIGLIIVGIVLLFLVWKPHKGES